jgi:biopolymer transport protein ExbB
MKTLFIISLCSITLALTAFGQAPTTSPPANAPASPPAINPAVPPPPIARNPAAMPAATAASPGASVTGPNPGASVTGASPGASVPVTLISPAAPPPVGSTSPGTSPAASATPQAGGVFASNFFIENFRKGGPIMWPILIVSIIGLTVVIERICWWTARWMRRDPKRIEKVFTAIETGDVAEASKLSRGSRDPVLRMMWNGLNHQHASLQGALQVAAGIEIKRAGRFLVVMDTLVTLAPLLGLLGTITGLIRSFSFLGNEELAVQAVTGGIAEALIATACGLGIAIFALVPFNFFTSRVSNLEFELQTAATNLEVMLGAQSAGQELEISRVTPSSSAKGSSI